MDSDEGRGRSIGRAVLVALAIGTAMSVGQALGPDIVDRARIWLDRAWSAIETAGLHAVEQAQARNAMEREARRQTGPVIWEAMETTRQAAEENL